MNQMAKTLYILPIHSFVDLITNSSSELFISKSNKTVEAVREILIKLVELEHQKEILAGNASENDPFDPVSKFNEYFGEIEVSDIDFNPEDCPDYDEYQSLHDYRYEKSYPVYQECQRKWREHLSKAAQDKVFLSYREIWKPWEDLKNDSLLKVLRWAFEINNLPWNYDPNENRRDKNSKFWTASKPFQQALEWNYTLRKGWVLVHSKEDNSIPYEMWNDIEHLLNADRRHLG